MSVCPPRLRIVAWKSRGFLRGKGVPKASGRLNNGSVESGMQEVQGQVAEPERCVSIAERGKQYEI